MSTFEYVTVQQILVSMEEYGMIPPNSRGGKAEDITWASNINAYLTRRGITITPFEYASVVLWLRLPENARRNPE